MSSPSDPEYQLRDLLGEQLRSLSLSLIPEEAHLKKGKELIQKVYELVAQKSKYSLARCRIAGSAGKKTSILGSDFDAVFFINGEEPPFEKVISDWEDIINLREMPDLSVQRTTRYSLKLKYGEDIGMDILPATYFPSSNTDGDVAASDQAYQVFQKLRGASNERIHAWSSGLAETNVKFMKKQSSFTHELARLCKYWDKTLYFGSDHYISGRSAIIEALAVHAGLQEEKMGEKQMLRAFRRFLGYVQRMNDPRLRIEFVFNPLEDCSVPSQRAKQMPILKGEGRALLRDAANPFLNLMDNPSERDFEMFKKFANHTVALLDLNFVTGWSKTAEGSLYFPLEYLLEPQPLVLPHPEDIKAKDVKWFKSTGVTGRNEVNPSMIVRIKGSEFTPARRSFVEGIKHYLYVGVTSFNHEVTTEKVGVTKVLNGKICSNTTSKNMNDHMSKFIDMNIRNKEPTPWVSSDVNHEDLDVTFVIPYKIQGSEKCWMVASIKWN